MTKNNPGRIPIRRVVIVGGGTAGWMTAAAAIRFLNDGNREIVLVESDTIGTVGVGEASIPPILGFNTLVGIDEAEFIRETKATFKLGIEFSDWGGLGEKYLHPFGTFGRDFQGVCFHQYWLKLHQLKNLGPIQSFSMSAQAALELRFGPRSQDPANPMSQLAYAYHFDAGLYAALLRRRAEADGVKRVEGIVNEILRDGETGFVEKLVLNDGREIAGDLFVDCSGFRALIIGEALGVDYSDWSHWLPCDRALAVPTARTNPLIPYTRSTARGAGWQWRIPLQHRTGNGHVFSSAFCETEAARSTLLQNVDGEPLAEPRLIKFITGMRRQFWSKNVVAIGLSGGFVEPLESTSIHLIQTGISKLLWLFPDMNFSAVEQNEYNRLMTEQFEYIRDFIVLHYKATRRDDTEFWNYVRNMDIPDTLQHKIELFREKGRIMRYSADLFDIPSWVAVMLGQNIVPTGYDTVVDAMDEDRIVQAMAKLELSYRDAAKRMPMHDQFIRDLVH